MCRRTRRSTNTVPRIPFSTYTWDLNRQTLNATASVTQPIYRGGRTVASTRRAENGHAQCAPGC